MTQAKKTMPISAKKMMSISERRKNDVKLSNKKYSKVVLRFQKVIQRHILMIQAKKKKNEVKKIKELTRLEFCIQKSVIIRNSYSDRLKRKFKNFVFNKPNQVGIEDKT